MYHTLLEMITSRELQPGHHLVETELARILGVSRQPIREALLRLQFEGWVDQRPAYGTFVHIPSDTEADELLAVRAVLEAESARLAAQHTNAEHVERLRDVLHTGEQAVASEDPAALVAANSDFHGYIVSMTGNGFLAETLGSLERRVRWYHVSFARTRGRASWDEHAEIVEAISAGKSRRACDLMRRHAERTRMGYRQRPR
ncbi:GntR family transcriptional regulator [Mycolicibacterium sp.]|uniref:GntR family transcriptional regulator n=1 Tax=Mycolicibacterium sp. TaxID=2320850 RepID=UPI0025E59A5A|nr:GntR family transcriptional regulator [Mycolicibacterium sp.]